MLVALLLLSFLYQHLFSFSGLQGSGGLAVVLHYLLFFFLVSLYFVIYILVTLYFVIIYLVTVYFALLV